MAATKKSKAKPKRGRRRGPENLSDSMFQELKLRIRLARTRAKLSRPEASKALHASVKTIQAWEDPTNHMCPRAMDIVRMVPVYETSADYLLGLGGVKGDTDEAQPYQIKPGDVVVDMGRIRMIREAKTKRQLALQGITRGVTYGYHVPASFTIRSVTQFETEFADVDEKLEQLGV